MSKEPFNLLINITALPIPFGLLPGAGIWEATALVCSYFFVCSFTHYLKAYKIKQELAALQRCNFAPMPTRFQWEKALSSPLHHFKK